MKKNDVKQSKQFLKAGRHLVVPFEICLTEHNEVLYCEKILRLVPGKRVVVMGRWNEQLVVAKIFFSRKAKQHFNSDVEGVDELVRSGIPTPRILFQGVAQDKKIHVIIFERILDSATLDYVWHAKYNLQEMMPILKTVILELATQHVMGIVQKDLHLKNFLLSSTQIYTLDGGDIVQAGSVLSKEQSIEHVALFFSQLGAGCESLCAELFDIYAKARGWNIKTIDRLNLENLIQVWNKSRWQHYQKKIMRSSTAFEKVNHIHRLAVYDRDYSSSELLDFIKNPTAIFSHPDTKILKAGRSSTVVKVNIAGKYFVVKRYNLKNPWHWLRRAFRNTRALKSWQLAHKLKLFCVPTAKPVAFVQNRFLGLSGTSYFVMEYIQGPHLGEYFTKYSVDEAQSTQMAERVMRLLQNLASLYLTHGDLKMTNILVSHEQPVLIDLDGMVEHKTQVGLKRAWRKEMDRFLKNWCSVPNVRSIFLALIEAC